MAHRLLHTIQADPMNRHSEWMQAQLDERFHTVRARTAAGESAAEIAIRLGVTRRTVQRYRHALAAGLAPHRIRPERTGQMTEHVPALRRPGCRQLGWHQIEWYGVGLCCLHPDSRYEPDTDDRGDRHIRPTIRYDRWGRAR